jgi:hypothetical protein
MRCGILLTNVTQAAYCGADGIGERSMTTREIPAKWGNEPAMEMWAETPFQRLRHRRYWSFWWRTNAKAAAISLLLWVLFAWMYVTFAAR